MSSVRIEQLTNSITLHCLRLGALDNNVYIISGLNGSIVVDPTYDLQLVEYIDNNNLKISAIILTHGHFDHCGGATLLTKKYGNIDIYCNRLDWQMANCASDNIWAMPALNCYPNHDITDGHYDIAGIQLDTITTPGHTRGSICFAVDNYLFTGDTLFANSIGRTDLEGGNYDMLLDNLHTITNLDRDYIVMSGHGSSTTLFHEKLHNRYLVTL